jgi:protein ImuB
MLCVWLPRFLTDRLSRLGSTIKAPLDGLLAVKTSAKGGNRLVAVNAKAEAAGLRPGMLLTDATAIAPDLRAVAQDLRGEKEHLRRLALGCRRYTPWTSPDEPDGLRLDISGCAHLFGGEGALMHGLDKRLTEAGFACRLAIADTPGAAWAMARFGKEPLAIIPPGEQRKHLAALSVRGLRIAGDKATALEHLGLKTIGQLADMPRPQLRARFGADLCVRLDQAFGTQREAVHSLPYDTVYRERIDFAEPVSTLRAIEWVIAEMTRRLTPRLREDGKGARKFSLTLFDTQGESTDVDLALARPSHDADHIVRLFRERLSSLEGRFTRDVAFDGAALLATRLETLAALQTSLVERAGDRAAFGEELSVLLDRLRARLGDDTVRRLAFRESHVPERAAGSAPLMGPASPRLRPLPAARPLLLLPRPEDITAMAELPDYPPRHFNWRGVRYRVIKAEGPEQIEMEWWRERDRSAPLRDYYAVEVETGQRFWVFREGTYTESKAAPRWFMHGLLP